MCWCVGFDFQLGNMVVVVMQLCNEVVVVFVVFGKLQCGMFEQYFDYFQYVVVVVDWFGEVLFGEDCVLLGLGYEMCVFFCQQLCELCGYCCVEVGGEYFVW